MVECVRVMCHASSHLVVVIVSRRVVVGFQVAMGVLSDSVVVTVPMSSVLECASLEVQVVLVVVDFLPQWMRCRR